MTFVEPDEDELRLLRPDPLLIEQELDARLDCAEAVERACGRRAGRVYWRSSHDYLYALELADLGRGRPSAATVFGFWDRYEPRPPEHEIDADLVDFSLWVASICGLDQGDVGKVFDFGGRERRTFWPDGAVLRAPAERFHILPGFNYEPEYVEIEGLRMAWVEAGRGKPIVLLHGAPAWGYLYRKMIPALAAKGRVIVPDLIGFGRSDKPALTNAHSYRSHARWLRKFLDDLRLEDITLVGHDWGGLLGLRLAGLDPARFRRLVAINTGLPDGTLEMDRTAPFLRWRACVQRARELDMPWLLRQSLVRPERLSDAEALAYQAPFPAREYQTAVLAIPRLAPVRAEAPGAYENRLARRGLGESNLPALLLWGARDAVTAPWMKDLRKILRQPDWERIEDAGRFLPEDKGEQIAARIATWLRAA